ncbi:MAG: type II secretion system protein GspD [Fimbriimonadaceae bacterium]
MTTALLAFWSCYGSGDIRAIETLKQTRHEQAVRRRHIAALKRHRLDVSRLFGISFPGLLGPNNVGATSPRVAAGRTSSTLASALFVPPTLKRVKRVDTSEATPSVPSQMQLVSLNVSDYEIQKFLPLLTRQTGLNIILMTTSPARVTMHVEKMPLIDVMRHVCALTGFAYIKASDAYVIAPVDALKAAYPDEWNAAHPTPPPTPTAEVAPKVTETYVANYIKATELAKTIKQLVTHELEVVAGPGQDTPSLNNADPSSTTGQSAISVTQGVSVGPATRTLILRGSPAAVAAGLAIAKQLDIPRSQVSIAVTIHDISDDAVKDLGLTWNFTDLTLSETPSANGIGIGRVSRSPMTFDAAIKALETRDVAHLMASPNVSLLDGEKAFILIGDRINYPVLTGYTATNSPIFSVNTERVGIYLQVAASISSDGFITLTLYPQVSSITGYLNVNGASYPQVSSREAQTTLRVKSGDTIVLGGLLQDQDIVNVDKVPILSSIPFFGELFKHRNKTKSKSQVIITIRPVIVPQTPK